MTMKKMYVGCALVMAPAEFVESIVRLKEELSREYEVLEFLGFAKGTNQEVYEHDIACVKACDLFLAECTYPSTGLGFELGTAVAFNKPIIAIAEPEAKISRLVLGIAHPQFSFHRYQSTAEVLDIIRQKISVMVH